MAKTKEEFKQEVKAEVLKEIGEKFDGFKTDVLDAIKQNPRASQNPMVPTVGLSARPGEERRARKFRRERDEILDALEDIQDALDEEDYDEVESILDGVLADYEEVADLEED